MDYKYQTSTICKETWRKDAEIRIHKINHNTERLVKIDRKWKKWKIDKEREKVMPYYSKDDLLTLYCNLIDI